MRINKGFVGLLRKKYDADTDFNELQVIKVYFCKNVSFEQKKNKLFYLFVFFWVLFVQETPFGNVGQSC